MKKLFGYIFLLSELCLPSFPGFREVAYSHHKWCGRFIKEIGEKLKYKKIIFA
jgi:hypothetical protein